MEGFELFPLYQDVTHHESDEDHSVACNLA